MSSVTEFKSDPDVDMVIASSEPAANPDVSFRFLPDRVTLKTSDSIQSRYSDFMGALPKDTTLVCNNATGPKLRPGVAANRQPIKVSSLQLALLSPFLRETIKGVPGDLDSKLIIIPETCEKELKVLEQLLEDGVSWERLSIKDLAAGLATTSIFFLFAVCKNNCMASDTITRIFEIIWHPSRVLKLAYRTVNTVNN